MHGPREPQKIDDIMRTAMGHKGWQHGPKSHEQQTIIQKTMIKMAPRATFDIRNHEDIMEDLRQKFGL